MKYNLSAATLALLGVAQCTFTPTRDSTSAATFPAYISGAFTVPGSG